MKTKTVKGLPIIVPKGNTGSKIDTPDDFPALHGVFVCTGRRGSGKSYAAVSLIKHYMDAKCVDRVFCISPTIHSNKALLDLIKIEDGDFYDEPNKDALDSVLAKVEEEAYDYEEFHRKLELWKKYEKYLRTGRGLSGVDEESLIDLFDGEAITPPVHKYNGKKPGLVLLIDDAQGSPLMMPKARLMQFIIKHRHHGTFRDIEGALGITVVFCVQSLKAAGGGIPRAIRGNCTGFILFKTKDEHELNEAASECAGEVGVDTFMKVYEQAMLEDHGFLFVDFNKKPNHPSMFRSKFEKFIIPEELEDEKKKCDDIVKEKNADAEPGGDPAKHRKPRRTRAKGIRRADKAKNEVDG